jgi:hypothetical protein
MDVFKRLSRNFPVRVLINVRLSRRRTCPIGIQAYDRIDPRMPIFPCINLRKIYTSKLPHGIFATLTSPPGKVRGCPLSPVNSSVTIPNCRGIRTFTALPAINSTKQNTITPCKYLSVLGHKCGKKTCVSGHNCAGHLKRPYIRYPTPLRGGICPQAVASICTRGSSVKSPVLSHAILFQWLGATLYV